MEERKGHFKLYKKGKIWISACLSIVVLFSMSTALVPNSNSSVSAEVVSQQPNESKTVTAVDFKDYFELAGSAEFYKDTQEEKGVRLTQNSKFKAGSIFLKTKIDMSQSFTLKGKIRFGGNNPGGDGIAVGFADETPGTIGKQGNAFGMGGLSNAFGVKFDTFRNNDSNEYYDKDIYPNNTMGLVYTDSNKKVINKSGDEGVTHSSIKGANNQWSDLTVIYDGKTKKMTVSGSGGTVTFDASQYIKNNDLAFFISASTGDLTNEHLFEFTSFEYTPSLTDIKKDQNKSLQEEHDQVVKDIDQDETLTSEEKAKQKADADKALEDGQKAIEQAKDADEVNQAFNNGKEQINQAHQPGKRLDEQKDDQNKSLQEEHDQVVKDIDQPETGTRSRAKNLMNSLITLGLLGLSTILMIKTKK
ncbi:lectin-like domain-containing protein [Fructobacillus parabroussonetiae]|uniref:DUF1542 domain-containing protein n=1 Tax=Fructobacillus parabroussonetiae TaxID=2713174 RepID=A0ABS5QWK0_9LACO|nr:DUF1542 domain-containing protein [Fructobacillus parabroussonetiae]MBS9337515.1 DUF1542 domain-containing protein [Fructobacillus parabroussonetiae]